MKVSKWKTAAKFFPWGHVQREIDQIDPMAYPTAVELAQHFHGGRAKACPGCGTEARKLKWFSVTSPEVDWDAGTGRVGFLTICEPCKLQVDFLIDDELTQMQVEQWRDYRALY